MKIWIDFDINSKEDVTSITKFLKRFPFEINKETDEDETEEINKETDEDETEEIEDKPKKKRGRPAKKKDKSEEKTEDKPKKKRGRPAKKKDKEISIGDVRKALKAYIEENDKDAVRAILKGFKAKKVSDLDEDDYPALLAKLAEPVETEEEDEEDEDADDFFDDDE